MVIFCEASVSIPLMHNVARNMKQHVRNPCAVCVRLRRSLCRGPALSVSGPGALTLSVLWICVGPRRSLYRGPHSLLSWRSLCRAPALSVSGPGTLSLLGALARRSLCAPALSGPGAPCVGPRRFLCLSSALSVSSPPLSRCLCRGALCVAGALYFGPQRNSGGLCIRLRRSLRRNPASPAGPQLQSVCHPSGPQVPAPIHVPPIWSAGPQLRSACHPSSPSRSLCPGENPKPYCLGGY